MVVTVPLVHVMQSSIDNVVNMIAMWDSLMATTRSMHVITTGVYRLASGGVGLTDFKRVFIVMILVRMV